MPLVEVVVKTEEEEEEEKEGRSMAIKEVIAPLRSAFRAADFERATAQLVLREEEAKIERYYVERNLKHQILKLTHERDELHIKYSEREERLKERVGRLEVENAELIKAMEGYLRNLEKDRDLLVKRGEVRVDDGGSGSVVDAGKSGEAVLEVEIDAYHCNGVSTPNDSGIGNGRLSGQDDEEPLSRPVIWICDSDDDCTPCPRQRDEGTGNASSAQLPSSLAATETLGLKITSSQEAIWENGYQTSKRKRDLPTGGHELMKLVRKPTTSFSNGEKRTNFMQDCKLRAEFTFEYHDFPAVPIAFISLTETKAKEVGKKWPFQADLVAALQEDMSLCLIAICALYRRARSGTLSVLSSQKSVDRADLSRIKALAEFIANGDKQCKPRKSVEELSNHDAKGLDDCKRLSSKYARELFKMYQLHGDSLFS